MILIITGSLEFEELKNLIKEADITKTKNKIASFMSEKDVVEALKNVDITKYEFVLLPGLLGWDANGLSKKFGVPFYKGPKNAYDLPLIIKNADKIELSAETPADTTFKKSAAKEFDKLLKTAKNQNFKIGKLHIGGLFPPSILAEIVDAPKLNDKEILERANYYIDNGAEILDIGAIASSDNKKRISEIVKLLARNFDAPISIDSTRKSEIESAVSAGADIVLSLWKQNLDVDIPTDTAIVVIPDLNAISNKELRIKSLTHNIKSAEEQGFKKIIADPVLEPPMKGLADSLNAYNEFKKKSNIPMLMGVGNVTELIDADSVGINAIIASLAMELNVALLLTTENSVKTRGAVSELSNSIKMNYIAFRKNILPKDLGITMLRSKSKQDSKSELHFEPIKECKPVNKLELDPLGNFKITIDHRKKKIYITYTGRETIHFVSSNAKSAVNEITERGLVSKLSHASYLGRELQKAEVCLLLGKAYVQDRKFDSDADD